MKGQGKGDLPVPARDTASQDLEDPGPQSMALAPRHSAPQPADPFS